MFVSLFVVVVGVCYCTKESNTFFLGRPRLSGPSEALVKKAETFTCELPNRSKNESVLITLLRKGSPDHKLGVYSSLVGQPGIFNLVIRTSHEGNLECVAGLHNDTKSIERSVSNLHYLKVIEPVVRAEVVVLSGPMEFFEGRTLTLLCKLKAGNHASYKWLLNDHPISQSHFHLALDNRLMIYRTTSKDSGSYVCLATNQFNNTVYNSTSSAVVITVKDVVSIPDISFKVIEDDFHNYSASVTCQSTRGTPPFTFSLYDGRQLIDSETSDYSHVRFRVPLVLGQHMGWLQCHANNGDRTTYSQWLPLEVVPVGGPANIHYDYDLAENYAVVGVRFYCRVAKGTHPLYKWFLNNSLLHDRGSFYYVVNQPPRQSILHLSVGRRSTGTYSCEVSNSFNYTAFVSSRKHFLDKEAVNRLPVLVVAVVFGCFILLIVLLFVCCCVAVVLRRRRFGENSLLGQEMEKRVAEYESELDLLEYNEDGDFMKTASDDEFDQASEVSLDEWPQIIEEDSEDAPADFP